MQVYPSTFFRGYSSLSEDNFFQLDGKDLTKFNLADRINLYYKVGNFVDIPFFNNEETFLMNRTGLTETFDDVLEVAKLIFEYCKIEAEKKRQEAEQMKADVESEGSLDNNTTSGQSNSGEPSMEEDGNGGEDGEEQDMQVAESGSGGLILLLIFKVEKSLVRLKRRQMKFLQTHLKNYLIQPKIKLIMLNYQRSISSTSSLIIKRFTMI